MSGVTKYFTCSLLLKRAHHSAEECNSHRLFGLVQGGVGTLEAARCSSIPNRCF